MSNVDIIAKLYASFGDGDLPGVLKLLHPEVRWHEAESSPYHPGKQGWIGPEAVVANLFERMGVDWSEFTVDPTRFHDAGSVVAVEGRYRATHSKGRALDCQFCHVWTVNGGQITRFLWVL